MSWRRLRTPSTETPGTSDGLGGRALGHDHLLVAGVGGGEHRGQHAAHRADPAVQAQLADHHEVGDAPAGSIRSAAPSTAQATARSKPDAALGHGGRAEARR